MEEPEYTMTTTRLEDNSVLYQQDKAAVDTQIATAKQYPRDIKKAVKDSVSIVTSDIDIASACIYCIPKDGKIITGASINLARLLAQNWGNLRIESKVISIEQKLITSQAIAFDLENNLAVKVEVKKSISNRFGRLDEDMIVMAGNIANSISMRNAILSIIPKVIIDKVYNEAKKTITGDLTDAESLEKKTKEVFGEMKSLYKVKDKDILSVIGRESFGGVTATDIFNLIGISSALKEGDINPALIFKNIGEKQEAIKNTDAPEISVQKSESKQKEENKSN